MAEQNETFRGLFWRLKWWWITPIGVIATLFLLLVFFSDLAGDSPFVYTLF